MQANGASPSMLQHIAAKISEWQAAGEHQRDGTLRVGDHVRIKNKDEKDGAKGHKAKYKRVQHAEGQKEGAALRTAASQRSAKTLGRISNGQIVECLGEE